jgi:hypothetical protein
MILTYYCERASFIAGAPQLASHNCPMPRAKGGKCDEQAEEVDTVTDELSTFTDADAPSLVFDAGGKSITIKQVRRLSALSNANVIALQTLGVTSHCGAIVWDAGAGPPPPTMSRCVVSRRMPNACADRSLNQLL